MTVASVYILHSCDDYEAVPYFCFGRADSSFLYSFSAFYQLLGELAFEFVGVWVSDDWACFTWRVLRLVECMLKRLRTVSHFNKRYSFLPKNNLPFRFVPVVVLEELRFWGKPKYSGEMEFILGVLGVGVSPFLILGKAKGP